MILNFLRRRPRGKISLLSVLIPIIRSPTGNQQSSPWGRLDLKLAGFFRSLGGIFCSPGTKADPVWRYDYLSDQIIFSLPRILTITCNPAVDKSVSIEFLAPEKKLPCSSPKFDPGGGGINIARVIRKLGGEVRAVFFTGGQNGVRLREMLDDEAVSYEAIPIRNDTRENLAVFDMRANAQYRFIMPGPEVYEEEWSKLIAFAAALTGLDYIIASGSLSPGMPLDFYARIAAIAKQKNARCIIDASGPPLQNALAEGLFLIKPNLAELCFLAGLRDKPAENEIALAARDLINRYGCKHVVVSQGAAGALLVTGEMTLQLKAPVVKTRGTVGAGDSLVGGIVYALSHGKNIVEAVKFGVICGTASTLQEGTGLCSPADIERLLGGLADFPGRDPAAPAFSS